MADLNGHEAGNGGHSQGKPTAYRDSSTRREAMFRQRQIWNPILCVELVTDLLTSASPLRHYVTVKVTLLVTLPPAAVIVFFPVF